MILVFSSPRQAFSGRLSGKAWILPLVLVAVLQATDVYLVRPLTLEEIRGRIESVEMPAAMKESMLQGLEKQAATGTTAYLGTLLSTLGSLALLGLLLPALLYWVGANFLFRGRAGYWKTVSVVGLSMLVFVPKILVTTPLKLWLQTVNVYTSLAVLPFVEPGSRVANMLNSFDLFDFWYAMVAAVGLSAVAGISTGRARWVTVGLWGFWAVVKAVLALVATGTWWGLAMGF
jgi:hypothetical protein